MSSPPVAVVAVVVRRLAAHRHGEVEVAQRLFEVAHRVGAVGVEDVPELGQGLDGVLHTAQ